MKGVLSFIESVNAVKLLVKPGPDVTIEIPGFPVDLAYPVAACPANCSCDDKKYFILPL